MINISRLQKSFGQLDVLRDINLTINRGEIYGLVGRSGAGKSTLLRCINGLEGYDSGSLLVNQVEVKDLDRRASREFRRGIGMIFQQFSLLNRLSVAENIALPMECWKYQRTAIDRKVKQLAELVGIGDKLRARPTELSGGQKQRVAIARALSMDPSILLCDEATSALDPQTTKSIIALLDRINRELNLTIVVVTHQMSVLRASCDRISILENGQLAESGGVEEIFLRQPQALRNLIGSTDMLLPKTGVNLRILLARETTAQPIITQMARELERDFLILGGGLESYRNSVLGSLVINLAERDREAITNYLDKHAVNWQLIGQGEDSLQSMREAASNA